MKAVTSKTMYSKSIFTFTVIAGLLVNKKNDLFILGNFNYKTGFGIVSSTCNGEENGFIWKVIPGFTGISNLYDNRFDYNLKLFPNPFQGNKLNIEMPPDIKSDIKVDLIDISGKVIVSNNYIASDGKEQYQFILPTLPKGLYFLRVVAGQNVFCQKVIYD
jgi:hypothetical protein